MSLVETFGDAISSLQTDSNGGPAKPSELEIAHTLFDKIAEKYTEKETKTEETKGKIESFQQPPLSFKSLLKKAIAVAILVSLFSISWVQDFIQKYTNNTYITHLVIFTISLVMAFVIIKKL